MSNIEREIWIFEIYWILFRKWISITMGHFGTFKIYFTIFLFSVIQKQKERKITFRFFNHKIPNRFYFLVPRLNIKIQKGLFSQKIKYQNILSISRNSLSKSIFQKDFCNLFSTSIQNLRNTIIPCWLSLFSSYQLYSS